MPRKYHLYTLTVRPHRRRTKGKLKKQSARRPKQVKVVARSKFDAELIFRNANPGMMVVEAERGEQVEVSRVRP